MGLLVGPPTRSFLNDRNLVVVVAIERLSQSEHGRAEHPASSRRGCPIHGAVRVGTLAVSRCPARIASRAARIVSRAARIVSRPQPFEPLVVTPLLGILGRS